MIDFIVAVLQVVGAFFMLIAAIGIVRMPDLYTRMSANTKSVTLGMGILLVALALHFRDVGVAGRAAAVIAFIALTVPIASHLIGRVAYMSGVELWQETIANELHDYYAEFSTKEKAPAGEETLPPDKKQS